MSPAVRRPRKPVHKEGESSFIQGAIPKHEPVYEAVDTANLDDVSFNNYEPLDVSYTHPFVNTSELLERFSLAWSSVCKISGGSQGNG